ncbi:MAG: hypothetical protein EZS28_005028 [Streblomastix strix]|uniref:C2 domain-containing protein n=1 Tax=Streblomastix strix TaxID=222440 RepID=A0A5J4WYM1_9EUKA|nr:MAG: hypothetical protein EZS28_005028 [Streblomastix strix]
MIIKKDTQSQSNPYIRLILGDYEGETEKYDECNGKYNETFNFYYDPEENKEIGVTLDVMDLNELNEYVVIGRVLIPLKDFISDKKRASYIVPSIGQRIDGEEKEIGIVDIEMQCIPGENLMILDDQQQQIDDQ